MKKLWNNTGGAVWRCLYRLILAKRIDWKESQLITDGGIVYTIREAEGHEREIKNARTGEWTKESETTFSTVPNWENYHREEYKNAIPFVNASGDSQSPKN